MELVELVQRMHVEAVADVAPDMVAPPKEAPHPSTAAKHSVVIETLIDMELVDLSGKQQDKGKVDLEISPSPLSLDSPLISFDSSLTSQASSECELPVMVPDFCGKERTSATPLSLSTPDSHVGRELILHPKLSNRKNHHFRSAETVNQTAVSNAMRNETEKSETPRLMSPSRRFTIPPWHHRVITFCLLWTSPLIFLVDVQHYIQYLAMFCVCVVAPILIARLVCCCSTYPAHNLDVFGLISIAASMLYWNRSSPSSTSRRNNILDAIFLAIVPTYFLLLLYRYLAYRLLALKR